MTTTAVETRRVSSVLVLALVVVTAGFPLIGAPVAGVVIMIGRERKDRDLVLVGVLGLLLCVLMFAMLRGLL